MFRGICGLQRVHHSDTCEGLYSGHVLYHTHYKHKEPGQDMAPCFHKVPAILVVGWAGGSFDIAEDDFSTDILLLAVKAVNAKVFSIQEGSPSRIEIG